MLSIKRIRISWAFQCVTMSATNCQRNVSVSNTFLSFICLNVKFMDGYFVCHAKSHCLHLYASENLKNQFFFIWNPSKVVRKLKSLSKSKFAPQKILSSLRLIWTIHFDSKQIVQYCSAAIVHSPVQRRTENYISNEARKRRRQRMNVLCCYCVYEVYNTHIASQPDTLKRY